MPTKSHQPQPRTHPQPHPLAETHSRLRSLYFHLVEVQGRAQAAGAATAAFEQSSLSNMSTVLMASIVEIEGVMGGRPVAATPAQSIPAAPPLPAPSPSPSPQSPAPAPAAVQLDELSRHVETLVTERLRVESDRIQHALREMHDGGTFRR